jgi:hypothetical protein
MNLRVDRRLVWIVDAGKVLDFAGPGLLVKTLRVALLRRGERAVDEYLD